MAIDLLSIEPHKISSDLSGYITYIFGAAKVGKTSLAAQTKDCLLIATEKGYNAIPGIRAVDVTSWSEMRQVYRELKKPEVRNTYKVLIVDTIDLAAKYCTKYICNQQDIDELGALPYGKGYNLMRSEFEDVFNGLTQMGYAVFFISHAQDSVFTRPDGTEYTKIIPSLSPAKVNAIIENMADIYGYAHVVKDENGESKRVLTLRSPDDSIACGCRFRYIDSEVPLSYEGLTEALTRAIDKEAELNGEDVVVSTPIEIKENKIDFEATKAEVNKIIAQIRLAAGDDFKKTWAPRIKEITDKYLGAGNKIADCTATQSEQMVLILDDLKDAVSEGV